MAWMRFTLVTPNHGAADEVLQVLNALEDATASLPGFISGGVFSDTGVTGHLGRFALWETREDADKASTTDHVMFLRSQLHNLIQAGHTEVLYEVSGSRHNIP